MPSLRDANDRFGTLLTVIEGGVGSFQGILSEPNQGEVSASQLTLPRRLLRVPAGLPVRAGMTLRAPDGSTFMVAINGASEGLDGTRFNSFRLFQAARQYSWQQRERSIDPITRLERDDGLVERGPVWGAYEPLQELFDRQIHSSLESGRFITTAPVQRDDMVNGMRVSRAEEQMGLRVLTLG